MLGIFVLSYARFGAMGALAEAWLEILKMFLAGAFPLLIICAPFSFFTDSIKKYVQTQMTKQQI